MSLKQPKTESIEVDKEGNGDLEEQEEVLLTLLEHRTREVERFKARISFYSSLLEEAETRLRETESKLIRFHEQNDCAGKSEKGRTVDGNKRCKVDSTNSEGRVDAVESATQICATNGTPSQKSKVFVEISNASNRGFSKEKGEDTRANVGDVVDDVIGAKEHLGLDEDVHVDLISKVCSSSSPTTIYCNASTYIPGKHTRKFITLECCPTDNSIFSTSAIDGVVKLWKLQARGRSNASILQTSNCITPSQHWPEDIDWHPSGDTLFCANTADNNDSQISIVNVNHKRAKNRVVFLRDKPHIKGIINSIKFMPWENCFVTGGSDHAVILWKETNDCFSWKPSTLHRSTHSSSVTGVAALRHKKIVLSSGIDKKAVGYDLESEKQDFHLRMESKCLGILPNPCDSNLFMVQTGAAEQQLRLYDYRAREEELRVLGFKQESSDSQSARISQTWSPDGLYLSSGSVDPVIHIFDIRYNSVLPSQSVSVHRKRVFKAVWHHSRRLLISISSDANIGLHQLN